MSPGLRQRLKERAKSFFRGKSPVLVTGASEAASQSSGATRDGLASLKEHSREFVPSQPTDHNERTIQHDSTPASRGRVGDEASSPSVQQTSDTQNESPDSNSVPAEAEAEVDLWRKALDKLSDKQKQSLLKLASKGKAAEQPLHTTTASIIPDLIAETRAKQEKCEKESWRVKLGSDPGDEIILRDQAALIIAWLTKAGDLGVSFAPSLVAHIWPCVKAVLQIPVQEAKQMAAVLQVADKVTRVATRGRIYEACFTTENTSPEILEHLHESLVALYKSCLELVSKAAGLLSNNLLQRITHSILYPDAMEEGVGSKFVELDRQLALSVQTASVAIDHNLLLRVQSLDAPVVRTDERVMKILETMDAREEMSILDWISSVQYGSHHDLIHDSRMADTCGWLLRHPNFQAWETSSGCTLLWLKGNSGMGKTFLTSKVIDRKKDLLGSCSNDEALAFFYFNRGDSSRNTAIACLQSLVRQLSTACSHPGQMQPSLRTLYRDCNREGRSLTYELCKKQLAESLNLFPRVTIILDAFDECNQDDRESLVGILNELMGSSGRPLLLFISSRPESDIRTAFRDRVSVEVGAEDNQDDIAAFVKREIYKPGGRWGRFPAITEQLKAKVVDTLLEKSRGMFRWTALQVDELLKLSLPEDVENRLGKLPKGLKEAYDEIYLKQDEIRATWESKIVDRAIMWVMAARQPLGSEELLSAVRIDPALYADTLCKPPELRAVAEDTKYITSPVTAEMLLDFCANLLVLDPRTRKWGFAHASVAEYFEEKHFSFLQVHLHTGLTSLALVVDVARSVAAWQPPGARSTPRVGPHNWLSLDIEKFGSVSESKRAGTVETHDLISRKTTYGKHRFVWYTERFWAEHVGIVDEQLSGRRETGEISINVRDERVQESLDGLVVLLKRFLGHPNDSSFEYRRWLATLREVRYGHTVGKYDDWDSSAMEKYAAFSMARFGFANLIRDWWQVSATSDDEYPRLLIDTAARTEQGWNILHVACYRGHYSTVSALLAAGIDANEAVGPYEDSPLQLACENGHTKVCRILIEKAGCDPNSPADYRNPLYWAARYDRPDVVRCLISLGADPDRALNLDYSNDPWQLGSPLAFAAARNNVPMLRTLIEDGKADPNMLLPDKYKLRTAALWAACYHKLDALRYLILDAHVDPNAHIPNSAYETIAIAAAAAAPWNWQCGMFRCLKECGVDFTSLREIGGLRGLQARDLRDDALERAARAGDLEALEVLLDEVRTDVNFVSRGGAGALAAVPAADDRYLPVLDYLLKKGADVNLLLDHGIYGSALAVAAASGAIRPMECLINHGADVDLALGQGMYGSALAGAVARDQENAVRLLLHHGADVNLVLRHGRFGTALMIASSIRIISSSSSSSSSRMDRLKMMEILCDNGANVNLRVEHGDHLSALMAAAWSGSRDKVNFLIKRGADVSRPENRGWDDVLEEMKGQRRIQKSVFRADYDSEFVWFERDSDEYESEIVWSETDSDEYTSDE